MNHFTQLEQSTAQHNPAMFFIVEAFLEERKSFGDRRRYPDTEHFNHQPIFNRRSGYERRMNFLNKEIFNAHREYEKYH